MKKLITILVSLVAAASISSIAFAQAAGPTGGGVQSGGPLQGKQKGANAGPIGPKVIKQLNLTREQMLQVKELVTTFKEKRDQIAPQGTKPNPKTLGPLRKQFIEDFAKILTPEQREKFKELMTERKKKGAPGNGVLGGGTTTGGKTGGGI